MLSYWSRFSMSGKNVRMRNPELYHVSIFGEPDKAGTWGWRFEGHHLSLNFTFVNGRIFSITPSFYGASPARVKEGKHAGMRVLADEEDKARKLFRSLSPPQKRWQSFPTKLHATFFPDRITPWIARHSFLPKAYPSPK